ncbi:MAG: glycerophosphodiester phosphodiesterase family protein [Amphiplicatus sp.]
MRKLIALAAWVCATALAGCAGPQPEQAMSWNTLSGDAPLVIAHRGASGYLPEHTLEAYRLAIEMGADVIEPDLVFTKDGVLVARHDRYLSTTTDVADRPEFADRKRGNDDPNDSPRADWWVEDFTLAELKTLRARQPFPGRSKEFDGLYEIPTFEEVLALATAEAAKAGRKVGVYPETKHPGFFASIGHDFEKPLLAALEGFGAGPVFIQSFEPEILKRLRGKTDAKLVQLVFEEKPGAGPNIPLAEIAAYADGVGPEKTLVFSPGAPASNFIQKAHALSLMVHSWTFRNDRPLPQYAGLIAIIRDGDCEPPSHEDHPASITEEIREAYVRGVDGVFTDFPDTATSVRAWLTCSKK